MKRTAVINIVGLTPALIGPATPNIARFAQNGAAASINPAFPAVTCVAQSNYLTGLTPSQHGIVANGWYDRNLAEVQFWKQSNHLVHGQKIWEKLRASADPQLDARPFTCAKLFWWYNMYSTADYSITPRPIYPADGRKIFDIYTWPFQIRSAIKRDLGEFPFPTFWGPAAGTNTPQGAADAASRWIAQSAKWIENKYSPTLSLIYLPHLDYNLQRHGPNGPVETDLRQIDSIVGDLTSFFQARGVQNILLSEYGITPVNQPIHINRILRAKGWLTVKNELGLEIPDPGASKAFAVADHQIAHIYINDPSIQSDLRHTLEKTDAIQAILGPAEKTAAGLDHPRAGDLILEAAPHAWFTYYYWLDDAKAPDFARCVDIHRKPGYDPVELFLNPAIPMIKLKILWRLLQKNLGFRMLFDVIPLDANLVKGSHGARVQNPDHQPLIILEKNNSLPPLDSTSIYSLLLRLIHPNSP